MSGSSKSIVQWAFVACATAPLAALGCGSEPPATELDDLAEDVETGQSRVVVCNEYQDIKDREVYVISAMNRKLYYFPDFAKTIGMRAVSDCEGARAFVRGYRDYRNTHPHFDAHQPPSPAPAVPDDPDIQSATLIDTVTKLGNGNLPGTDFAFPKNPVVYLSTPGPNRKTLTGGACSGTFIAKNFILTAAHCMNVLTDKKGRITFDGNTMWTISWSDASGSRVRTLTPKGNSVKQLTDGAYIGSGTSADDDLALLYLDIHTYDNSLPPNTDDGAAMRLSLVEPSFADQSSVAGWASPPPLAQPTLRVAPAGTLLGTSVQELSFAYNRAKGTDAMICHGDSGGPLYRTQLVGGKAVPVLVGVSSNIQVAQADADCVAVGENTFFARIDNDITPFIESRMNVIYGTDGRFTCRESPQGTAAPYVECWGLPCTEDSKCPSTNYCSRPAIKLDEFNGNCPVCTYPEVVPLGVGCTCISGQCLSPLSNINGF